MPLNYPPFSARVASQTLRLAGRGRPLTIIPLGDSETAASSTFTSNMWIFAPGYAEASIAAGGGRYQEIRNAGVAGNTTAQMLARIQTDVIAYNPDCCLLLGGTNDISSGMSNASIKTMMNNLEQMVVQLLSSGILPILVTIPPKNGAATESRKTQWFYYQLAEYYGLPLLDLYRICVDPAAFTFLSSYSGDGTHLNATAIAAVQAIFGPKLASIETCFAPPYLAACSETTTNTGFWNSLANGAFINSGTPPTPDHWSVSVVNASNTLDAPTQPYTGKTFDYVKTVSGGAFALSGAGAASAGGAFAVGDNMFFSGHINVSGLTPSSASGFAIGIDPDSGGHARPMSSWVQNGDFTFGYTFIVPAATTSLVPSLFVNDAATYKVNNLTLVNVTQASAIWQPGQQSI